MDFSLVRQQATQLAVLQMAQRWGVGRWAVVDVVPQEALQQQSFVVRLQVNPQEPSELPSFSVRPAQWGLEVQKRLAAQQGALGRP